MYMKLHDNEPAMTNLEPSVEDTDEPDLNEEVAVGEPINYNNSIWKKQL